MYLLDENLSQYMLETQWDKRQSTSRRVIIISMHFCKSLKPNYLGAYILTGFCNPFSISDM